MEKGRQKTSLKAAEEDLDISQIASSIKEVGSAASQPLNLRSILDALPFYVLLLDRNHHILEANSAVYSQLGVKRDDILGKYCPKVIHNTDSAFPGCPLEEAVKSDKSVETELFDKTSGRWSVSAVYKTNAVTEAGDNIYLHLVNDITEKKIAQEQLKESHRQLRQLSAHLDYVREEEKRSIARELHDETSQLLASLSAHLETAMGNLPADAQKSLTILRKAQEISKTVQDEIDNLIHDLRPVTLDGFGLISAVSSLIESRLKVNGIKVNHQVRGEIRRLPVSREIILYRIIQEAINNIVRHSEAKRVKLWIYFRRAGVKVVIQDNGVGFNIEKIMRYSKKPQSWGLLGMRERVDLLDGKIKIETNQGKGTEITVEVPYGGEGKDGKN